MHARREFGVASTTAPLGDTLVYLRRVGGFKANKYPSSAPQCKFRYLLAGPMPVEEPCRRRRLHAWLPWPTVTLRHPPALDRVTLGLFVSSGLAFGVLSFCHVWFSFHHPHSFSFPSWFVQPPTHVILFHLPSLGCTSTWSRTLDLERSFRTANLQHPLRDGPCQPNLYSFASP